MKYVIILGDGMSDYAIPELNGKTPLEAAYTPAMDYLAQNGRLGMVRTIPEGLPAGSDTANLSVFGYDPKKFYSGRAPLEAVSIGIPITPRDAVYRCNFVTLSGSDNISETHMKDYCAGEIESSEAAELIDYLNKNITGAGFKFFAGKSYRNCFIRYDTDIGAELVPPHDISKKPVKEYLPEGIGGEFILSVMAEAYRILPGHPINQKRRETGQNPANAIWLWGEGRKPELPAFTKKYGLTGAVISAVDLIEGIGILAGLDIIKVDGATGNYNTNYRGKSDAAIAAMKSGCDFVYIHIEAPDECGHRSEIQEKVYSIEKIDSDVLKPIFNYLLESGEDFSILLTPDHPTPISLMTHTKEPVPFVIYKNGDKKMNRGISFTEFHAKRTGIYIENGYTMMDKFIFDYEI